MTSLFVRKHLSPFLIFLSLATSAGSISGKIHLDSTWKAEVYLSQLNSFEELSQIGDDLIISSALINKDGTFRFDGIPLLNNDRILRLHVRKKGDPISTIIIGGRDQNHIHFILKSGESVHFDPNGEYLFQKMTISGYSPNGTLHRLGQQSRNFRLNQGDTERAFELVLARHQRKLMEMADSSTNLLAAVFIINELKKQGEPEVLMSWLENWLSSREDARSIYLDEVRREFEFQTFTKDEDNTTILIVGFGLLTLVGVGFFIYRKRTASPSLGLLTVKERQVFDLLKEGKTNKEIASIMHVEQSTEKSHVNSIFSKLNIKSRNQILDFKSTTPFL